MGSTKKSKGGRTDEKPIRLNDLIPSKTVTGGRRTVFGTQPPPKSKPPK